MANIAEAFTQTMMEDPAMFVRGDASRTNGKAIFLDAYRIKQISPMLRSQVFEYASAWTKPWQDLDSFKGVEHFKTCHHMYSSPAAQIRFHSNLEHMIQKLDEYIDQLPEDYHQCSTAARTFQAFFDEVWTHI